MDKLFMYLFYDKKDVSAMHRKLSLHHENEIEKNYIDYIEMILDWESARYTKPDKPLNAYDTLYKYYPNMEHEILPILKEFEIDKPNLPMEKDVLEYANSLKNISMEDIEKELIDYIKQEMVQEIEKMKTNLIYFVHGTTYDNASKKCSGWKQVELNNLGKEQAENLGRLNSNIKFDVIFTSDLIRAIDSANIAFPNIPKIQDQRLRECNYGDLDGEDKQLVIYEEHIYTPFPNGESLKDVEERIDNFIKDIKEKYKGKTIGIVAHRAPQLAFEVITKNISWEEANKNDWRKTGSWQPGWQYNID